MKTTQIKLTALSFAIAMIAISYSTFATSFPTFAAENNEASVLDLGYFEEYFDAENFTEELEIKLFSEVRIQVYNETGNLIATGSEKDEKIKSLLKHSDLLTEVIGTKYYRLSYQPAN